MNKDRLPAAERTAHPILKQFAQILESGASPFLVAPKSGYTRAVDFYAASGLLAAMAMAANGFRAFHGRLPDIVNPLLMTDKIFWSKFFRPMKVPETGNKLRTGYFIPEKLRDTITCPPIVWHAKVAKIPRGDEIEPGAYYLKASHGSDMFQRVNYPITDEQADALDARFEPYLSKRYQFESGEWWYSAFTPELLLEKAIGTSPETTSWNFYVIGGRVVIIIAYQKTAEGIRRSYLGPDFMPMEALGGGSAVYTDPSPAAKTSMMEAATAIGAPLGFVRVDFLLDDDERPYVGEITFTPANALNRWSPEVDLRLGSLWDLEATVAALVE